jgi:TonB family protein
MENPGYNNEENKWVEERIAGLTPPPGWRPDADRAFERVMQGKSASTSTGLRVLLAAATLAAIAVVLILLPWHMLWTPSAPETPVTAQQDVSLAQTKTETSEPPTVTRSVVPAVAPVQEEIKQQNPAAPVSVQQTPPGQRTRGTNPKKKEPRIFASAAEKEAASIMQAAAQGQDQPAPPPSTPPSPPSNVSEPVLISQVRPAYTPEAREARIQGTVELLCVVRDDGIVQECSVKKSLGYGLDEAAIEAVGKWRFVPGKKDGKPVNAYVSLLMNFSLR